MPRTESPTKRHFLADVRGSRVGFVRIVPATSADFESGCSRQSRQAKCEWGQRQAFNLGGPEIAFVGQVSGSERSGADDLAGT